MIHTYNGILVKKNTVLIVSKGDGLGFKNSQFKSGQHITLTVNKAQEAARVMPPMAAVVVTYDETNFSVFGSIKLFNQKESTVGMYNLRVLSANVATPKVADVPDDTQALTLIRIVIAAVAQSGTGVDVVPFDMTLDNAKKVVAAFDSKDVHFNILDDKKAIVFDNRVVEAPKEVKPAVKPRYNPMESDNFYISPEGKALLSAVIYGIEKKQFRNANIMLVGNSGNGKTSLAYILAKVLGYNIVKVSPANVSDPEQFLGYWKMDNATTTFVHTDFSRGITTPKTVVLIDEINRAHSSVLNGILNVLDDTREVGIKGGVLKVAEDVIFVATMNEGTKYAGTFSADFALLNRFTWRLEVGYLPQNVEIDVLVRKTGIDKAEAKQVVKLAEKIRTTIGDQVDMSTRTTLSLATARKTGLPLRSAIEFAFVQGLDPDTRKVVVDMLNSEPGWGVFDAANSIVGNIF